MMSLLAPLPAALCSRRGVLWRRRLLHCSASVDVELPEVKKTRLPHTPVLLNQVLAQFHGCKLRSFVDCTLGAGGHSHEMIKSHPELSRFVGLDVDSRALELAQQRLSTCSTSGLRLDILHSNFRNLRSVLEQLELAESGVDGILMDLGVSSMQVDAPERGFSYHLDGPLDMRMDTDSMCNAATVLNEWPEAEIARVLRDYGEEKRWKFLTRRIVDARSAGGVSTTAELVKLIGGKYFAGKNKKLKHPAMRTFQALRIAVNDELRSLELALSQALECLRPGGKLAVITFHSLEDRIVKHHFLNVSSRRDMPSSTLGLDVDESLIFQLATKRALLPDDDEMEENPRCKSAKLRAIQRVA